MKRELTKEKKFVRKFAYLQLILGMIFLLCFCTAFIFPWIGLVNLNGVTYEISEKDLKSYKLKVDMVLENEYPEYKDADTFWESFATVRVYDLIIDSQGNISFCVNRNYRLLGIDLGEIGGLKDQRFLVDVDNSYERMSAAEGQDLCEKEQNLEPTN